MEAREIDGLQITLSPMPGRKGYYFLPEVLALVEPLVRALGGILTKDGASGLDISAMLNSLPDVLRAVTPEKLELLTNKLLAACLVDGKPFEKVADIVFQGKSITLTKLLVFAIEVNYQDFFDALKARLAEVKQKQAVSAKLSLKETSEEPQKTG